MIPSPSPSFNDLIGMQYNWSSSPGDGSNKTNCFAMCMEARKRLGLKDFRTQFEALYKEKEPSQINARQIIRLLRKHTQQITDPRPGSMFCLPSSDHMLAMAVIVDDQNCLLLSPRSRVTSVPFAKVTKGKYYWTE